MNYRNLTSLALALSAMAAPAFAGGLEEPVMTAPPAAPVAPPAYESPQPVSGTWTGFYAGAQLGYGNLETDLIPDGEDFDGGTLGLHAGYLYDFGSIVAGAEVDIEKSNIEAEATGVEIDRLSRAKLRVGYDAGAFLPYATAGVVQAETAGALVADDTGRFVGAGVEYRMTDRIRVGGEVLQHNFEDFGGTGEDIDATTASARVSFQF